MKNILFALVLTAAIPAAILAQGKKPHPKIDSLEQVVPTIGGAEKLKALEELVNTASFHADAPTTQQYIDRLREEAVKQGDKFFISAANFHQAVDIYYYQFSTDSIYIFGAPAAEYAWENKFYDHYFSIQLNTAARYGYGKQHEKALAMYNDLYERAVALGEQKHLGGVLFMMGTMYKQTGEFTRMLETLLEGLEVMRATGDKKRIPTFYVELAFAYNAVKEYDKAVEYADSVRIFYDRTGYDDASNMRLFEAGVSAANAFLNKKDTNNALRRIRSAEKLLNPGWPENNAQRINILYVNYYRLTEEYNKALEYSSKLIDYYERNKLEKALVETYGSRGHLLYQAGRFRESADAFREFEKRHSALSDKQHAQKLSELRTLYEVDKLEMQAEQDRLQIRLSRNYIAGLSLILALMIAIVVIVILNTRRLRQKNRSLFDRVADYDRQAKELRRLKSLLHESSPGKAADSESNDNDLYARMLAQLEDPTVYADPRLTRKSLAALLSTNETYLRETISRHTGLTFTEYITGLRLTRARHMLLDNGSKYSPQEIADACGFGSISTFYRLFRSYYGMSPESFRSSAGEG
ncbi:helix-turn-helix domain-containing protein [uncultured Alistipes sp.]|jgi:AraC-type DNA-binding domain-containing proteins|uniref:helix-turn-helix domain-containing protein n=1 Tax=uncultured Alistipes sp. TaxID=538949 RepID=UPI0025F074AD|nr:helix-turn-helix domain-containing protein [uncultured Alistipes sp.]